MRERGKRKRGAVKDNDRFRLLPCGIWAKKFVGGNLFRSRWNFLRGWPVSETRFLGFLEFEKQKQIPRAAGIPAIAIYCVLLIPLIRMSKAGRSSDFVMVSKNGATRSEEGIPLWGVLNLEQWRQHNMYQPERGQ